uniref:Putative ovule protein n=1 Tax=Solanum chacoense TaxID=4108 RepID=A0A0V0HHP0_SOLCH
MILSGVISCLTYNFSHFSCVNYLTIIFNSSIYISNNNSNYIRRLYFFLITEKEIHLLPTLWSLD